MKVLIPACNMESRLRNKYVFFLQNWLIFGPFCGCVPGGRVGWCAPMCVGGVGAFGGARFAGGESCVCTPRACVCVCTHGGCACACVPWRERVPACAAGLCTAVAVHIWPCVFIYVVRKARSSARTHPRAWHPPVRWTRVGRVRLLRARLLTCLHVRACPRVFVATSSAPRGSNPPCRTAV